MHTGSDYTIKLAGVEPLRVDSLGIDHISPAALPEQAAETCLRCTIASKKYHSG